jgi:hypothetical protein
MTNSFNHEVDVDDDSFGLAQAPDSSNVDGLSAGKVAQCQSLVVLAMASFKYEPASLVPWVNPQPGSVEMSLNWC